MIEFNVPAMSCGHCVKAVTEAVHAVDPQAEVKVDLAGKKVDVRSNADRNAIAGALTEAGYPPSA